MMHLRLLPLTLLTLFITHCVTDRYSFIRYGQSPNPRGGYVANNDPRLNDVLALNYAGSIANLLRAKYTGARITREISSTAQITLAAVAGAAGGGAFNYSKETLAILGLGSAGIPELQRIFGAKERAQVYQDAVRLIEEAQVEYLAYNQKPSSSDLTQNGVTLLQRVTASVHVVEKTLAGNLPTIEDMQKATERMSQLGAVPHSAGNPAFNLVPANGDPPMDKTTLAALTGQLHPEVTVAPPGAAPTPTAPVVEGVVISQELLDRREALGTAYKFLLEESAAGILTAQKIERAEGAAARDILALHILKAANAPNIPGDSKNAVAALSTYRKSLSTTASITNLENIYTTLEIPVESKPLNLAKRNLAIRNALENASLDKLAGVLTAYQKSTKDELAPILLEASDKLELVKKVPGPGTLTPMESLTHYRLNALNDVMLTISLEKGCAQLKLPGFAN